MAGVLAVLLCSFSVGGCLVDGVATTLPVTRRVAHWATAQAWLARADWFNPRNPDTQLMRAQCFRQLRDMKHRDAALELARKYGASRQALRAKSRSGRSNPANWEKRHPTSSTDC